MPVLQPTEYDASYFEGASQSLTHNAGYSDYSRVQYNSRSTRFVASLEESSGTVFGDMAIGLNVNGRFIGKKMLVVGCAYGYLVQKLRDLGVDAWGIDVSPFAIGQADPAVAPYLEVADARVKMQTYRRNEWDFVLSRWFLSCMSDTDLPSLITEMNRVTKNQIHIVNPIVNPLFYNQKTLLEWADLPFAVGTILIPNDDFNGYFTVIN